MVPATIEKPIEAEAPVVTANPLDLPADTFREGLDRRKQNRAALMAWVRDAFKESIERAVAGIPTAAEVVAAKSTAKHPFAAS